MGKGVDLIGGLRPPNPRFFIKTGAFDSYAEVSPCTFTAGMFPGEYVATIHYKGGNHSLFVPKSEVKPKNGDHGLLRVRVVDQEHHVVWLPGELIEDGRWYIEYPGLQSA